MFVSPPIVPLPAVVVVLLIVVIVVVTVVASDPTELHIVTQVIIVNVCVSSPVVVVVDTVNDTSIDVSQDVAVVSYRIDVDVDNTVNVVTESVVIVTIAL
jgi:hypothetical protein